MTTVHKIQKIITAAFLSTALMGSFTAQAQNSLTPDNTKNTEPHLNMSLGEIEQEVLNRAKLSFCETQNCALISNIKINSFDNITGKIVFNLTISSSALTLVETPFNLIDMEILSIKKENDNFNSVQVSPDNYLLLLLPKLSQTTFTIEAKVLPGVQNTSFKSFNNYIDLNNINTLSLETSSNSERVLHFQSAPSSGNSKGENKGDTTSLGNKPQASNLQIMPQIVIDRELNLTNNVILQTQITTMNENSNIGQIDLNFDKLEGEEILKGRNFISEGNLRVNYIPGTRTEIESQLNLSKFNLKNNTPYVQRITLRQDETWNIKYSTAPQVKNRSQMVWWLLPEENIALDIQKLLAAPGTPIAIQKIQLESNYSTAKPQFTQDFSIVSSIGAKVLLDKRHMSDYEIDSITLNNKKIAFDRQSTTSLYPLILTSGNNQLKVIFNAPDSKTKIIAQQKALKVVSDTQQAIPARNFTTKINQFKNKWLLWSWGAEFRPSILLWGLLIVIGVASYGLGKFAPAIGLSVLSWFLLMTGLTQSGILAVILAVIWFGLLYLRRMHTRYPFFHKALLFNLYQIFIIFIGIYLFITFFDSVSSGLLGSAQIFIAGPNSSSSSLYFYSQNPENTATVLWLPVWCYRTLMFAWSIWLAFKAVSWVRLAWESYSQDGIWKNANTEPNPASSNAVDPTSPAAEPLPAFPRLFSRATDTMPAPEPPLFPSEKKD